MSRSTKYKFAVVAGVSECLVYAEAKYCAFEIHGEPKYYVCQRAEYCCNFGCCVSPGFQIYHLWYYWLLVIIMFLVCSGGGWWYRYWLQGRYRAAGSAIPTRSSATRAQSSLRSPSCQAQQARISYNTARNTVLLHRMWKVSHRSATSPAYGAATGNASSAAHHYQNTSVVLNDVNCPYYQLYGPPPSYETVIAQTRGKLSTPSSPELLRGASPRDLGSSTAAAAAAAVAGTAAFVGPACFYGLPPGAAVPQYQPVGCPQGPPPGFDTAEYHLSMRLAQQHFGSPRQLCELGALSRTPYDRSSLLLSTSKSSDNSDLENTATLCSQDSPEEGGFHNAAATTSSLARTDCVAGYCSLLPSSSALCSYTPKWNSRIGVHKAFRRDRTKIDSASSSQSELASDQQQQQQSEATTSAAGFAANFGFTFEASTSSSSPSSSKQHQRKIQGGSLKMPRRREQQAKHYEAVRVLAANRRLTGAMIAANAVLDDDDDDDDDVVDVHDPSQPNPSNNVILDKARENDQYHKQQREQAKKSGDQGKTAAVAGTSSHPESKRKLDRSRSLE